MCFFPLIFPCERLSQRITVFCFVLAHVLQSDTLPDINSHQQSGYGESQP